MPSIITEWHQFHGPLVAFAVTLGLAVMGRFLRVGLLATAAGGAGVVVGWFVVTGRPWMIPPQASVDALTGFAVVALLIGLLLTRFGQDRHGLTGMVLSALVAAWFLSGAPRHQAALRASWPIALGVAVAVLLFARVLAGRALDPLRLALAGLTLAAALHVAGAPAVWVQLALVPGWRDWRCWPCRRWKGWQRCRLPLTSAASAAFPSLRSAACRGWVSGRPMPPLCRPCWQSG